MKRAELKKILEEDTVEYRRYYRRYGDVYLFLRIWEDYEQCLEKNRRARIRPFKERAREEILDDWSIGANTFYHIHQLLRDLCEDVE